MTETELQVFIDGIVNYFEKLSQVQVEVGSPYLIQSYNSSNTAISASIGISGKYSGMVYFFAPKKMLARLLFDIGEEKYTNEYAADLAGEAANTIAGNARRHFGKDFMISVPVVHPGGTEEVQLAKGLKSYAIPILWKNHESMLILSI